MFLPREMVARIVSFGKEFIYKRKSNTIIDIQYINRVLTSFRPYQTVPNSIYVYVTLPLSKRCAYEIRKNLDDGIIKIKLEQNGKTLFWAMLTCYNELEYDVAFSSHYELFLKSRHDRNLMVKKFYIKKEQI